MIIHVFEIFYGSIHILKVITKTVVTRALSTRKKQWNGNFKNYQIYDLLFGGENLKLFTKKLMIR